MYSGSFWFMTRSSSRL